MSKVQKRTFSLTEEQSGFIDRKVASGEYASSSEVIRQGLRAMQERDAAIEKWLREEVVPTLGRIENGTEKLLTSEEVRRSLRDEYERLVRAAE